MKNNYYSNYQGYLKNGNRVASFGIEKEGKSWLNQITKLISKRRR